MATMRDVAALAGVSIKTVSRVVNAEPGVSADLAGRVLDAVRMLDYRHNLTASSLRRTGRRKTAAIGLVLEDVGNPFSSALHRAVEEVARARGSLVFAASNDESPQRQRELLDALVSRRVDGLIVVPVGLDPDGLLRQRRTAIPLVCVDRPAPFGEGDSVTTDNREGAQAATEHLGAVGHRRIGFLGDVQSIWTAAERFAGYRDGLAALGLAADPELVRLDVRGTAMAERAVGELLALRDPPTALLGGQNLVTTGVIRAVQQRGLQRRVAVAGFDDLPLADLLDPALTVVAQDPAGLGRAAAEQLFARLDGDTGPSRHIVVHSRLIARGSGEIAPPAGPAG